jgi:hypothetical protein
MGELVTAPDPRLVDAVAAERFGDAWPLFNDAGRDVIREQITDVLTAAVAVGWTPPEGEPS